MSTVPVADHLTISEAAEEFGVSRQRMHVLIRDYGVEVIAISPRLSMVKRKDLEKIPKTRPPGPRQK